MTEWGYWKKSPQDKMGSLLVTAQSQYSVHIIFVMSCEPAPGNYNILSYIDGNVVNTCPSLAPADVVILNNVTPVSLTTHGYMLYLENVANRSPSQDLRDHQSALTSSRSTVDM